MVAPLIPAAAAAALALAPDIAQACGGTFCDNTGGNPMPVDQRGEDILFVQDGPEIEVHVRIQYEGDAEHFAWLVPLQALPEVSVGSDLLFGALGEAAAPRWRRDIQYQCPDEAPNDGGTLSFVPSSDFANSPDPEIVLEETVGAFEVVVLQGGTVASVMQFLADNGYEQDPAAAPILQEYLDEGFLFAAVKLTAAAEVEDIHPLVFRMAGDEPCVPLRLTRIAAQDDMGVRAYFLGQDRWAPLNYLHVELNTLAFPWSAASSFANGRFYYTEQVTAAVDAAGGRAFVTDYAGDSSIVDGDDVFSPSWDDAAFIGADPIQAIDLIAQQGLNTHPLIQPLLMQFIPPPMGVDPTNFWNNIESYQDQIDLNAWDDVAFAAALAERIIDPALHAVDLIDAWPYLTRLQTTISPEEMTVDPIFIATPDLGEVSNERVVVGEDSCGETGRVYQVPWGGDEVPVCMSEGQSSWPGQLQNYPARKIEKVTPVGPPQVIEDFSADIVADWTAYQDASGCGDPGGSETSGGDPGSESGDQGMDAGDGTGDAGVSEGGATAGCACQTSDQEGGPLGLALGLLGLALIRRRG